MECILLGRLVMILVFCLFAKTISKSNFDGFLDGQRVLFVFCTYSFGCVNMRKALALAGLL